MSPLAKLTLKFICILMHLRSPKHSLSKFYYNKKPFLILGRVSLEHRCILLLIISH